MRAGRSAGAFSRGWSEPETYGRRSHVGSRLRSRAAEQAARGQYVEWIGFRQNPKLRVT
jgi:hypothetical protein